MSGIIITLLIFSVIVTIHEFGHFSVAKLCGIKVEKFAIGMGPVILKKVKGETEYSIRLFPVGGFCAMDGEDTASDDPRAFANKSVGKRIAVIVAGPVMNLILGLILSIILTCTMDVIPTTIVDYFADNAKSAQTGLQLGDEIVRMNGMKIYTDYDIAYQFGNTKDGVFDLEVKRNGEIVTLDDVTFYYSYYYYIENDEYVKVESPEAYEGNPEDVKLAEFRNDFRVKGIHDKNFITVMDYSLKSTVTMARLIWISFIDMFKGTYKINDLSGPIGIATVINEARTYGFRSVMQIIIMITLNLGIFNLIPFPSLDGGRLIFLFIEAVIRKKVPQEMEGWIHLIGMALLFLLMIVVFINDIAKLVHK